MAGFVSWLVDKIELQLKGCIDKLSSSNTISVVFLIPIYVI